MIVQLFKERSWRIFVLRKTLVITYLVKNVRAAQFSSFYDREYSIILSAGICDPFEIQSDFSRPEFHLFGCNQVVSVGANTCSETGVEEPNGVMFTNFTPCIILLRLMVGF